MKHTLPNVASIDREAIEKHDVHLGKRVKRDLFRTAGGFLLNADANASFNIMRMVFGDAVLPPSNRGFIGNPERVNISA